MRDADTDRTVWSGITLLLRAFSGKLSNWLVLARNLIPVAGVCIFGWQVHLTVFSYWLDGVSLFALLVTAVVARVAKEQSTRDPPPRAARIALDAVVGWIILFGMIGIPYWIAFGALQMDVAVVDVLQDGARSVAFACIVVGNAWNGAHDGLAKSDDAQFKRRVQSGLHTLIVRAVLMMLMTTWGFGLLLIPAMALVLTATEVWPQVLAQAIRINSAARLERA